MKSRLLLDQFCNPLNAPAYLTASIVPVFDRGQIAYKYPTGTIFEGEQAVFMCKTGQCVPIDDECATAAGMTPAQAARAQVVCRMANLGINSKEDQELYMAGVIEGYDDKLNYIPGKNWEAYQAAKKEASKDKDDL